MGRTRNAFTEQEKMELRNNPYTFRVTDYKIVFTLAFKEFVLSEIDKPLMNSTKVFLKAGYPPGLIPKRTMQYTVAQIRKEAASKEGLREPKPPKAASRKKNDSSSELEELKHRVQILEQQIDFLKKTEHVKKTGQIPLPRDSS